MEVTPDSTPRIVLTREIRTALNLEPRQSLEVSVTPGGVLLTPLPSAGGKLVRKRKLKVYTGKIPNVDVEEAVSKARLYPVVIYLDTGVLVRGLLEAHPNHGECEALAD
jgi:hypothetical protein